ncbi:nucleotidyltransferase family protein [Frondihabitans cladoniiphilus]|uniref:Polymerase beta nucleotidyltransferase domain-containing protein n=1 Tax=Frondihabitans cladoniiphilus TaxID=715785 RepID=A0ABP8WAC6_9MICO
MTLDSVVSPVAEVRAGLSQILAGFRADPDSASPVILGAHRRPEAVLIPFVLFDRRYSAVPVVPAPSILDVVSAKRALIRRLAALNHVGALAVFGSVARREERPDSDVDFLVDPDDDATLFDLAQLEIDLEALLDRPVDVVSRRSLDAERDRGILTEALPL